MGVLFEMLAWGLWLCLLKAYFNFAYLNWIHPCFPFSLFPIPLSFSLPGLTRVEGSYWYFFFFLFFFLIAWENLEGVCILSLRKSSMTQILKLLKIIYWEHIWWQKAVPPNRSATSCFTVGEVESGEEERRDPLAVTGRPTRGIKCFPRNTLLSYCATFPI